MQSQTASGNVPVPSAAAGNGQSAVSSSFGRQIDPDNLEDLLLCLSYLKQRELFLYKMAEDPSHKAMLYFLELMMNSDSPLPVAYLASKLNGRPFTPEMVRAVGEHEDGLRRFLARYPSLFSLNGNMVSLNDITTVSNTMMLTPTPTPTSAPPPPSSAAPPASTPRVNVASKSALLDDSCAANLTSSGGNVSKSETQATTGNSQATTNGGLNVSNNVNASGASSSSQSGRTTATLGTHTFACSSAVANALASIQRHNAAQAQAQVQTAADSVVRRFDEDAFLLESEAVRYFTEKLVRRTERWVPIKSLAGHLSQASAEIRQVVGPQSRFRKFLVSQPRVFEVQAERDLVALRDEIRREYLAAYPELDPEAAASPSDASLRLGRSPCGRPKSLNLGERAPSGKLLCRSRKVNSRLAGSRPPLRADDTNGSADPDSLADQDAHSDDTASLLNAVTAIDPDLGQRSVPDTPLELQLDSPSVGSPPPATPLGSHALQSCNAVAALRDALANAVRDGASCRVARRSGTARVSQAANRADSSSSSSASSETTNARRKKSSTVNNGSQSVTMTADEYAAIEFVRKFVERATKRGDSGQGTPIQLLVTALGDEDNDSVRRTIGWTLTELEAFLKKHSAFFELTYSTDPSLPDSPARLASVANRRLSRNAHIIIAGGTGPRDDPCVSGRTMTNRCGRIFHVVKLWGIIDLGRHEHVFFDKSLLKHVDDLSKYFHVGQTVWFNAILAPKDSRAKWRATQVWNAADRLLLERAHGSGNGNPASTAANAALSPAASTASVSKNTDGNECELLTGQPTMRMQLADDVRFLDADNEEDLIKLLDGEPCVPPPGPADPLQRHCSCPLVTLADEHTLEMRSGTQPEDNLLYATNREDVKMSEYVVPMPTPLARDDEHVAPLEPCGALQRFADAACQTLSTGDILATQLYHDDAS